MYGGRFFSTLHDVLTVPQNNILVDLDGTARIAGLGSAHIPSQNHHTWSEIDAELLFYGTAPELVRPHPLESRIRTTKESDVYAFALLTWEVSYFPATLCRTFAKLCKSTAFCRTGPFLGCTSVGGDLFTGERYSAGSTSPPRTLRSSLEHDTGMLARRPISSYINQKRCCCPRHRDLEKHLCMKSTPTSGLAPLAVLPLAGDTTWLWTCAGRMRQGKTMYTVLAELLC